MAKRLQHEKCGHEEAPVDPIECILSLLTGIVIRTLFALLFWHNVEVQKPKI